MKNLISFRILRERILSKARYPFVTGLLAMFTMASVMAEASLTPTKPVVIDGATVSGLPSVKLDGTGTFLEIASKPDDFDGRPPGKTTLIVFRPSPDGFGANQRLFTSGYARVNTFGDPIPHYQVNTVFLTATGEFRYQQRTETGGGVSQTVTAAGAMSTENFTIGICLLFDDGTSAAGIRDAANTRTGIVSETFASAVPQGHTFTRIGGASSGSNPTAYEAFYNGEIAAFLAYNRALSFEELISVEEWLYDVYLTPAGGNPNLPPVTSDLVVHINSGNLEVADGFVNRMTDLSGRNNHADTFVALENRLRVVSRWTNPGEGSWGDAANWNPLLPISIDSVRIDNGGTAVIGDGIAAAMTANNGGVGVDAGTSGTLRIEEGGTLLGGQHLNVGTNGTGVMIQQGGLVEINNLSFVGRRAGSSGTYSMLGGVFNTNDILRVGDSATATGVFSMEGGEVYARNGVEVGSRGGQGTWTMSGGLVRLPTGPFLVGNAVASVGTLNLDGGIIQARGLGLAISPDATGTVNWNAGEVQAGALGIYGGANGVLNWGGGTLRPIAGNLVIGNHAATLTLVSGGSGPVISSRGANDEAGSVTIADSLGGSADLTIEGNGVVVFASEQTYTGTTTVAEGTLQVDGILASGNLVTVQTGATLSGSGTIQGATTVLGKLAPGSAAGNVLTFGGNLDLSGVAAGGFQFNLGGVDASSRLVVNGTLNLGAIDFSDFVFVPFSGFGEGDFVLFEAQEVIGEIAGGSGSIGSADASIAFVNNQLILTVEEVPEAEEVFWAVTDGQWDAPANWNPARVPGGADAARIWNGGSSVLTGSGVIDSLSIRGGSHLRVSAGANLTTISGLSDGEDFAIEGEGGRLTVNGQVSSVNAVLGNLDGGLIDTKSESFATAESAAANGWVELFSRQDGMNFGFSSTNIAGGAAAGEAGGVFKRNNSRHMYVDPFEAGKLLTLDDAIVGSGKIRVPAVPTGNAGVVVGHTNASLAGGTSPANAIGLHVASNPRFFVSLFLANGTLVESLIINPVPTDRVYDWHYAYDPNGGNGFGQLVLTLTDTVTQEDFVGTLTLTEAQRQVGAFFDAFGLTSRVLSTIDVQNELYIDDVTYSVPPSPAGPGEGIDSTVVIDGGSFVASNDIRLAGGDSVLQVNLRNGGMIEAGHRFVAEPEETGQFRISLAYGTRLRQGDAENGVELFNAWIDQGFVQVEHPAGTFPPTLVVSIDGDGYAVLQANLPLKSEFFDSAESTSANGWVEMLSRQDGQDFGFSNTNIAGGAAPGEAGGVFRRNPTRSMYADVFGAGTLTLDDEIMGSGRIRVPSVPSGNAGVVVGHTDSSLAGASTQANVLGIVVASLPRFFVHMALADGTWIESLVLNPVQTDRVYDWRYAYDPNGGNGFGQLVATFTDSITGDEFVGTLTLTEAQRQVGAVFDAFGLTSRALSAQDVQNEFYIDDVTYTVPFAPTTPPDDGITFAEWAASFDLPAGQDGPGDNPAGDGIVNALKFALALNPNLPSRAGLPVEQIENIEGELYLTLTFDRPVNIVGLTYHVDASSDLADWPDAAVQLPNPTLNGDGTERVTFRDVEPVGTSDRRFLRLRVELD